MTKIAYLRKCVRERYKNANLADAAEAGEALLREHWNNQVTAGIPYADDIFNLALVYDEMGAWDRALEMYAESARLVHEEEGDSLGFVSRMSNIAALLSRLGRTDHAYRLYAHTVAILRMNLGPAEPALADGLYNMANAAADIGNKKEALRLHEEALRIREEAGADDDAVHSLHSLAFLLEEDKNGEKSLQYAKEALDLTQAALENPHMPPEETARREHDYYSACFYLANLYENRDDFEKAESLYASVLRWADSQGGTQHSAYLNVALRLANMLTNQEKYQEAITLHREIAENFKRAAGESHLFYANNLRSMALLYKKLNEYDEAEALLLKSIKIRRAGLDEITMDAMILIDMYLKKNQSDKALEMLVYILMDANTAKLGYEERLNALAESFARAGNGQLETLSAAMEELCRRDKLQAIIQKWNQWEKE